jgi:hypothetical protein
MSLVSPDEADAILGQFSTWDARLLRLTEAALAEDRREAFLVRRRAAVVEPELRFFLAVLLNVRGRDRALSLVAQEFPGCDPVECVVQWVRALGRIPLEKTPRKRCGDDGVNMLGFDVDDVVAATLAALLRGLPDDDLLRTVAAAAGRKAPLTVAQRRNVNQLATALQQSEMFGSLLA